MLLMPVFQQKPAQRGSGQISLKDIANFEEITKKADGKKDDDDKT